MWAFPRKPFVDMAMITCRGREKKEEVESFRGVVAQNLIAVVSV